MTIRTSTPPCILCGEQKELVRSHVISNFLRKRFTGEVVNDQLKYSFSWKEQPNRTQNLPQSPLMCKNCDNTIGARIEGPSAEALTEGRGSDEVLEIFQDRRLGQYKLALPDDAKEIDFVEYFDYRNAAEDEQGAIGLFAVLTAWRALHAMARSGQAQAISFLASLEGRAVDEATRRLVIQGDYGSSFPYPATLLLPDYRFIWYIQSDRLDQLPFAWAFMENTDHGSSAVVVWAALWVIVWPLAIESDSNQILREDTIFKGAFLWPLQNIKPSLTEICD